MNVCRVIVILLDRKRSTKAVQKWLRGYVPFPAWAAAEISDNLETRVQLLQAVAFDLQKYAGKHSGTKPFNPEHSKAA